jgi:hypothetical protein
LIKRTSINSIPQIHKEKEMADFRKWIYALAVVALLAGFTVPASAQAPPFQCVANAGTPPIVRAEGFTELVGDLTLNCTGGTPTSAGQAVPQVNFQIFLNTNVTSRILVSGGAPNFNEALIIIDEPNSPVNPARPILACGAAGAPDTGPSGLGVCAIVSTGNPAQTYDGTSNGNGIGAACGSGGTAPVAGTYGCGRPNVFQGRTAIALANGGNTNSVVWLGVPLDPPGTTTSRTVRITNVRANAVGVGVSSTFTTSQIQMNISVSGNTAVALNNPQQIVAYVQRGLVTKVQNSRLDFVQCNDENPDLFLSTTSSPNSSFKVPIFRGKEGFNPTGGFVPPAVAGSSATDNTPLFRFQEGFGNAWKVKNIAQFLANGTVASSVTGSSFSYNGTTLYPADLNQNVPGAIYNTESGFESYSSAANPTPNPPAGFGFTTTTSGGVGFPTHNGENNAGIADHGTRLAMSLTNIPNGVATFVPPVIYLYHQGTSLDGKTACTNGGSNTDPTVWCGGFSTGVMVLTSTDANGGGPYSPATCCTLQPVGTSGLVVYEVLYEDPFGLEQADVPVVVSYQSNLQTNLPQPGILTQAAGGFAPFYASSAASSASVFGSSPDVPRFIPSSTPATIFTIAACNCNLLFPYVASAAGFDTGIAIANTSLDPGAAFGFLAKPQSGKVTFWYYGTIPATGASAPPLQTSNAVPAGQVLTYVLSNGGGSIGTAANGLDNRAAGFVGYIIAQAGFQYCHAYAYVSALGAGPTSAGTSEGYLGIVLDNQGLPRTLSIGENKAH